MNPQLSAKELAVTFLKTYDVPHNAVKHLLREIGPGLDMRLALASIPPPCRPSHRPLHTLYVLLTEIPGPWPTFDLIKCQKRVRTYLPERLKEDPADPDIHKWLLDAVDELVKSSYKSFDEFLHCENRPALRTTSPEHFLTHQALKKFASTFFLHSCERHVKSRVAIALPNGALLAAICIAVTTYYVAAPINPATGPEQFRADIRQLGARCILTTREDYERLRLSAWVSADKITVIFVEWNLGDVISLTTLDGQALQPSGSGREPNQANDIALVLFTSGTSGSKKVVPLTIHSILAGTVFVMESWGLEASDACLNMMPLYHVGGLVRNVFAPIFSGGSTIYCPAFDPGLFWDVAEEFRPTWYYASPSVHSVILREARSRPQSLARSQIRLVCNAAGGLLPSLARQLRDAFNCVVLPSYGMTECIPISTPPLDYKLDREGSSGTSTGPELSILDWTEKKVHCGTVGRICVRGEPVFPGYIRSDGTLDKSAFNEEGWFDTGDMGYMDESGFLYITGRSKEVINRGGELISPFEVENAILSASLATGTPISGRVSQVLAFSVSHNVLQEAVGAVLVTPPHTPRVDLKALHSALRSSLQQDKWPALITYMDDLPKRNNKVLRISLGKRLNLPELTDDTSYRDRHWEATCPPLNTPVQVDIPSSVCRVDFKQAILCLDQLVPVDMRHYYRQYFEEESISLFIAPRKAGVPAPSSCMAVDIRNAMSRILHGYMVPDHIHTMSKPFETDSAGNLVEAELQRSLDDAKQAHLENINASTQGQVTMAFSKILSRRPNEIPADASFFDLGGDSLKAGGLALMLRSTFHCPLSINIIFIHGTVRDIAAHIESVTSTSVYPTIETVIGCVEPKSSTNLFVMALQLIPMTVVYPLRRGFQWTIFMVVLTYTEKWPFNESVVGRLFNLVLAIISARMIVRVLAPFVGILAKWIIIGRYREGLYPMWGMYHTRWWLAEKVIGICGEGFFSINEPTRRLYCRLMGARVGKGVRLAGASLGEYDLLDIRDGASLTHCVCRPFAAEGNTSMYLGRIIIGENSSITTASVVAAGSEILPNTCLGPNSSSWELGDAGKSNHDFDPRMGPQPHWLLTGLATCPLLLIAWFTALLPWFGGLLGMVAVRPSNGAASVSKTLTWFAAAGRIEYYYLALVLRSFFSPFILFAITVFVKMLLDVIFGRLQPGLARNRGAIGTWRAALIKTLLPLPRLHEVTDMFGKHYEATSIALRMLGSKIGKRVYWPDAGPFIGDYHLLEIGNDVVLGSWSHMVTTDAVGSERIAIRDQAMVSDRVVLLPGVEVGQKTMMGPGTVTRRRQFYAPGATYVNSRAEDAMCLSSVSQFKRPERQVKPNRRGSRTLLHHSDHSDVALTREHHGREVYHVSSHDTLAESHSEDALRDTYPDTDNSLLTDSDGAYRHSQEANSWPFGRAFYLGQANYRIIGQSAIFCYSAFMTVFTAFYWNVPGVSAIQIADKIMSQYLHRDTSIWWNTSALWLMVTVCISIITTIQAVLALAIVVGSKWLLLGQRKPGNYDRDKSSYCQRWEVFLCIEKLRRHCYHGAGVLGMLTGTHWIVLYFRAMGADIGKDCAIFANGRPSLVLTEPDLVRLGNRVVIDDASVVAHTSTRGKFDLDRLEIGDRCVLRTGSRLLGGATMKEDSCLLEHTLITGGDVVEAKWTMQGWPAERFSGRRVRAEFL